jgi:hypothetical protein
MTPLQNRATVLLRRMADVMQVRNYSQRTIDAFGCYVGKFADLPRQKSAGKQRWKTYDCFNGT